MAWVLWIIFDRALFVIVFAFLPFVWKLDKTWFAYAVVLGVLPAMSGHFISYTRFASVVFPVFVVMALRMDRPIGRLCGYLLLSVFAVLHVILLSRFLHFKWAG